MIHRHFYIIFTGTTSAYPYFNFNFCCTIRPTKKTASLAAFKETNDKRLDDLEKGREDFLTQDALLTDFIVAARYYAEQYNAATNPFGMDALGYKEKGDPAQPKDNTAQAWTDSAEIAGCGASYCW